MLELLLGDKYNLKPESLLILAGNNGLIVLPEMMTDPYTPLSVSMERQIMDAESATHSLEAKTKKEFEYGLLFGIANIETALRSALMDSEDSKTYSRYNVFLYKEEGKEPFHIGGTPNKEYINSAEGAYNNLVLLYKTSKSAYESMDPAVLKKELSNKLEQLSKTKDAIKNPLLIYSLGYVGSRLGGEYGRIAEDALSAIEKSETLRRINLDCSQVLSAIFSWSADLVMDLSSGRGLMAEGLRAAIDKNNKRIDDHIKARISNW